MFSASDTGLGDDPQSWAVNGLARVFMHKGEKQDYKCAPWKEGDVIGIACDLVQMQMRVSLNGNFAAPDGAVFELDSGAVGEGLFAAFSGQKGMVRYNLGGRGSNLRHRLTILRPLTMGSHPCRPMTICRTTRRPLSMRSTRGAPMAAPG